MDSIQAIATACTILGVNVKLIHDWLARARGKLAAPELAQVETYLHLHGFISVMSSELRAWKFTHDVCQRLESHVDGMSNIVVEAGAAEDVPPGKVRAIWERADARRLVESLDLRVFKYWRGRLELEDETTEEICRKLPALQHKGAQPVVKYANQFVLFRQAAVDKVFRLAEAIRQTESLLGGDAATARRVLFSEWNLPTFLSDCLFGADQVLVEYLQLQEHLIDRMPDGPRSAE